MIKFEIPGEVKGKGRPRFARVGEFVKTYSDEQTVNYENWVKQCYVMEKQKQKITYVSKAYIEATINVYYPILKSVSRPKHLKMINKQIRPDKKPDADNIAKIILDALNGLAYDDDKQVVDLRVLKWYGEESKVVVSLMEI